MSSGGLHQLRHFYASALLAGGVDIRALAEYLGHHEPAVTLRIYAHLMPSARARALRAIEDALGEAGDAPGEDHGPEAPRKEGMPHDLRRDNWDQNLPQAVPDLGLPR
jgi:Phage integrase family